jgi:hypothetical protein
MRSSVPSTFGELDARSLTLAVMIEAAVDRGRGEDVDGLQEMGRLGFRIDMNTELRFVVHVGEEKELV